MGLGNAQWQFLTLSSTEAAQSQQRDCQRPFTGSRSCSSELPLLRAGLTDEAVLFKARAALPVEGQPTSPRLGQLTALSHLRPGRQGSVSWPAPCVGVEELLMVNAGELLHSVPHVSPHPRAARQLSCCIIAADARQSPQPEPEAGGREPHVHGWGAAPFLC